MSFLHSPYCHSPSGHENMDATCAIIVIIISILSNTPLSRRKLIEPVPQIIHIFQYFFFAENRQYIFNFLILLEKLVHILYYYIIS